MIKELDMRCPKCGKKVSLLFNKGNDLPYQIFCKKCEINAGANTLIKCKQQFIESFNK